jgi:hypothetical protein
MTPLQIVLLITAGPYALIQFMHAIRAAFKGGDFHILQGIGMFLCVVAILVSFLGVS